MRRLFVGTRALMEAMSWVIYLPGTKETFWLYVRDECMIHVFYAFKFEERVIFLYDNYIGCFKNPLGS